MKCSDVRPWLYVSRADEPLPSGLRRHLRRCPACRRRRQRLLQLDEQMAALPALLECEAARQRFLDQVDSLPAAPAAPMAAPKPRRPVKPFLYWAASILIAAGLTVALINWLQTDGRVPPGRALARSTPTSLDQLVLRFVDRDLRLADSLAAADQMEIIAEMADDLRGEAVRQAEGASADSLPLLSELYDHMLQRGVVGRLLSVPAADRTELMHALTKRLRKTEAEVAQVLDRSPEDLALLLRPIHKATQQARERLASLHVAMPAPALPPRLTERADSRQALLAALVLNGVRLAEEPDPLRRADYCSDVADQLLQAVFAASAQGEREQASLLSSRLGEFMQRGVSANLARVSTNDPRIAELRQVTGRAAQILTALDRTLENMTSPPGARQDAVSWQRLKELEIMLKDVEKGLKKVQKSYKDGEKGPPKGKDLKGKDKGKGKAAARAELTDCEPAILAEESLIRCRCKVLTANRSRPLIG